MVSFHDTWSGIRLSLFLICSNFPQAKEWPIITFHDPYWGFIILNTRIPLFSFSFSLLYKNHYSSWFVFDTMWIGPVVFEASFNILDINSIRQSTTCPLKVWFVQGSYEPHLVCFSMFLFLLFWDLFFYTNTQNSSYKTKFT